MTWALQRQLFYVGILAVFFIIFGFLIIYPKLNRPPTCMDNKQNGIETGVDCGGSCTNACRAEVEDISVLWSRSFEVVPGRYNAVAYIVNHNKFAAVDKISYRFRFADKDNVYLGKRDGSTIIPPGGNFAIFEGAVDMGQSVPVYTTFEFIEAPHWIQVAPEKLIHLKVLVSDIKLENETSAPYLSATIKNYSLFDTPEGNVVAILYDAYHNAVSVSSTYLDKLAGEESQNLNFTWPQAFNYQIVTKEIIPMYNISRVEWK